MVAVLDFGFFFLSKFYFCGKKNENKNTENDKLLFSVFLLFCLLKIKTDLCVLKFYF